MRWGEDDREAAFEGKSQSTIRHCRKVNESSLYSVPHWNYIRLYLPKGSGGFRSPKTHPKGSLWLGCFGRLYEKESGSQGFEQARSADLRSLFLAR